MARRVFFSFHYIPDNWRTSQVRSIGALDGNKPCSDNDWEKVTKAGDAAIKKWIDDQMYGRGCAVVLIGAKTAGRKWITYEINKAWEDGKGVVGIHIHNLKDSNSEQATKGSNPFDWATVAGKSMSGIVKVYNPPYSVSTDVYDHISQNIETWIEEAVKIRAKY